MCMKDYVKTKLLDGEDPDKFALWAFGEDYNEFYHAYDFMDNWNQRHGDKLILKPTGRVDLTLNLMIDLWRDFK